MNPGIQHARVFSQAFFFSIAGNLLVRGIEFHDGASRVGNQNPFQRMLENAVDQFEFGFTPPMIRDFLANG